MQEIALVNKHGIVKVDDIYYQHLNQFKWYGSKIGNTTYAMRKINGKTTYMHRHVMEIHFDRTLRKTELVDHIDGDGLNNQIENLRLASQSQNISNSKKYKTSKSPYKGVYFNGKYSKPWCVKIMKNGKNIHSDNRFNTPEEAAYERDLLSIKYFGEYTNLNFEENRMEYIKKLKDGYNPDPKERVYNSTEPGVYKKSGKWAAVIWIPGEKRQIYVGTFDTEEQAVAAIMAKLAELGIPYTKRIKKE